MVIHDVLCRKLKVYVDSGYLDSRGICVTSGVPQGAVLSLLLFINDIPLYKKLYARK